MNMSCAGSPEAAPWVNSVGPEGRKPRAVSSWLIVLWLLMWLWSWANPVQAQAMAWFADGTSLYQVDASTRTLVRTLPFGTNRIAADIDGGVWAITQSDAQLIKINAAGQTTLSLAPSALNLSSFLTAVMAADPRDGSLWLARRADLSACDSPATCQLLLRHVSTTGQLLHSSTMTVTGGGGYALSVDQYRQPWIASEQALIRLSEQGVEQQRVALPASTANLLQRRLVIDPLASVVWVAEVVPGNDDRVLRVDIATTPAVVAQVAGEATASAVESVVGAFWTLASSTSQLTRRLPSGTVDLVFTIPTALGTRPELAMDPFSSALWVGGTGAMHIYSPAGQSLALFPISDTRVTAISITPFRPVPRLTLSAPPVQTATNNATPAFQLLYSLECNDSTCNPPDDRFGAYQLSASLDSTSVSSEFVYTPAARIASYVPSAALSNGPHSFSASIVDRFGQQSNTVSSTLVVDTVAPQFTQISPPDGSRTTQAALSIAGTINESSAVTLGSATQQGQNFTFGVTLIPGTNALALNATDGVGNLTQAPLTYYYLTVAISAPADGATVSAATVAVTGSFTGPADTTISVNGVSASVTGNNFTANVPLAVGANTITVTAASAGVAASQQVSVSRQGTGGGGGGPLSAPPVEPGVATTVFEGTKFLYSGSNPVQVGVAPGTIEAKRAAVLRGRVMARDGTPLAGATVTINREPQFGQTQSRADGFFDLVVNGGGALTLNYTKDGFLPIQRTRSLPWQDFAAVEDVVMTPLDGAATSIALTGMQPTQVARGSAVTDSSGMRRATVVFPAGTTATMLLPDGSRPPLPSPAVVRATEYTVGASGPGAMPGTLPPTSAYTYAVELSVDAALDAGATEVRFSRFLPIYLENFLGFPVGTVVPFGYYDKVTSSWKPAPNGKVIKVLSISDGKAVLDIDGNGLADSATEIRNAGISEEELVPMAGLYSPGTELWRFSLDHFTPVDGNPGSGGPPGAVPPPPSPKPPELECPNYKTGSIIECETQVIGETVSLTGVPFTLNYRSDRVPGNSRQSLEVTLTDSTVPTTVKRVEVTVSVAGKSETLVFPPTPNLTHSFSWDGLDIYGRPVYGGQPATVDVGYVYDATYIQPAPFPNAFATTSGIPVSLNPSRQEMTYRKLETSTLSVYDARSLGLGGWTPSIHHQYDTRAKTLLLGGGGKRAQDNQAQVISTVAGTGTMGVAGDGGLAANAQLSGPTGVAFDRRGNMYIADSGNGRLRRVSADGTISTVFDAGTPSPYPMAVTADGAGNVYFSARSTPVNPSGTVIADRVYMLDALGVIHDVAGGGILRDNNGASALMTKLTPVISLAVDAVGNVYLLETGEVAADSSECCGYAQVQRVDVDRRIYRVAGSNSGWGGEQGWLWGPGNIPAAFPAPGYDLIPWLGRPNSIAVDRAGVIYIGTHYLSDQGDGPIPSWPILAVRPDGTIHHHAGSRFYGGLPPVDGGFSKSTALGGAEIALLPDGQLVVGEALISPGATESGRIRLIDGNGIVRTIAGGAPRSAGDGDGGPATSAHLSAKLIDPNDPLLSYQHYLSIGVSPAGEIYVADTKANRVRKIGSPLPAYDGNAIQIVSSDGSEVYRFDANGRHLRTLHSRTGAKLFEFFYDTKGALTSIMDASDNITRIEHDAAGAPSAVISPDGHRTTLTVDVNGFLETIEDPNGRTHTMGYLANGLITSFSPPKGNASTMSYSTTGALQLDQDAAGGYWDISRTNLASSATPGFEVTMKSAMNRMTKYRVEDLATGDQRRTTSSPDGTKTVSVTAPNKQTTVLYPDQTTVAVTRSADPRFGMGAPLLSTKTTLPSGKAMTSDVTRSVVLTNPAEPLSLVTETTTRSVNGKSWIDVYTSATRETVSTTPQGRTSVVRTDLAGRPTYMAIAGLTPIDLGYDSRGRLKTVTQGAGSNQRSVTYIYGTSGFVDNIVDALPQTVQYQRDAVGQPLVTTLPGNRALGLDFDANGNLSGVTPPGRTLHSIGHNLVDLEGLYTPPPVAGVADPKTVTTYNLDKELKQIDRPDGSSLVLGYNALGQLQTLTPSAGSGPVVTLGYMPTSGQLQSITTPDAVNAFTYDGYLLKSETFTGAVVGSITLGYNSELLVNSLTVNGTATSYGYDNDGLLTQAGALSITPHEQHGMPKASTLGAVTTTQTYSGFGEPDLFTASIGGSTLYSLQLGYDRVGRVTSKTEAISGGTSAWEYGYDAAGRLETVKLGGVQVASYGYDANGNRTTVNGTVVAAFDAQDRLQSYGAATYVFGAAGDLQQIQGAQTTTYSYDIYGNLRTVVLPTATVTYKVDGSNRRVAKLVNGTVVQRFLYQDQLKVAAELDVANTVVARFVYGGRPNVPEYMIKGGVTYRIITDHLGSVRLVVDSTTGAVAQRIDYDAWGQVTSDSNPGFQPFGFAGGLYDRETGLVRFGARDYDSNTGRWTAKDPIRFEGGDANIYAYVGGEPVSYADPEGLNPSDKWYGFNNPAFRDYVHGLKQEWNLPPGYTFDKEELKNLNTCWKEEGEPRGKGGKSGKGGRGRDWNRIIRGGGGGRGID